MRVYIHVCESVCACMCVLLFVTSHLPLSQLFNFRQLSLSHHLLCSQPPWSSHAAVFTPNPSFLMSCQASLASTSPLLAYSAQVVIILLELLLRVPLPVAVPEDLQRYLV